MLRDAITLRYKHACIIEDVEKATSKAVKLSGIARFAWGEKFLDIAASVKDDALPPTETSIEASTATISKMTEISTKQEEISHRLASILTQDKETLVGYNTPVTTLERVLARTV